MTDVLARAIDDARRRWVPDHRLGVFEVRLDDDPVGARALRGVTTSEQARDAMRRIAVQAGLAEVVRLLPDTALGEHTAAVVTAAVAPLNAEPAITAQRVSEVLHGESLVVLERRDAWLRVRAGDGYHGWMHAGYVALGTPEWAADWDARATARSFGCELRGDEVRLRLPIGARLALRRDQLAEAADGQACRVVAGVVRPEIEMRAEARFLAATEWALRWFGGAPYAWAGRTEWGCDCSGLTQAVYAARGIALPRDSDQQVAAGREVAVHAVGRGYEAGDLLFFADGGRVSHVAIWAGTGRIVHAALSRGGVARDDLFDLKGPARRLRTQLVAVRRVEARSS